MLSDTIFQTQPNYLQIVRRQCWLAARGKGWKRRKEEKQVVTSSLRNSHTTSHPRIHISPRKSQTIVNPRCIIPKKKSHNEPLKNPYFPQKSPSICTEECNRVSLFYQIWHKKNQLMCHTNQVLQISLGQRQLLRSEKRKELKKNIGTARVSALFVSLLSQN